MVDRLSRILLRQHLVAPGLLAGAPVPPLTGTAPYDRRPRKKKRTGAGGVTVRPGTAGGLIALEADLLHLGHLLSAPLRHRLGELDETGLANAGRHLVQAILAERGGHVGHVPLFRNFPESVPADTAEFYVRRVFALLLQEPAQPCVLCGGTGAVHPVSPCAHLVCRTCWDGADFSACPICHRRIDPDDPFLRPADDPVAESAARDRAIPARPVLLSLCDDPAGSARDLLQTLLTRQTPLRPEDLTAVIDLTGDFWPDSAGWLPERIPVRETRAAVLATAVRRGTPEELPGLLDRHTDSATDVLRLLHLLMGGDAGLRVRPPRRSSPPRPLRQALLSRLDRMSLSRVLDDLHRHPEAWKHMAEVLHPFERYRRYPDAALAFAVLRGTRLDTGTPFAEELLERAAAHPGALRFDGVRLRPLTFAGQVEAALRDGDHSRALDLLVRRPGELTRRLAHLARSAPASSSASAAGPSASTQTGHTPSGTPAALSQAGHTPSGAGAASDLAAALTRAAPAVSPGVLISALGRLRTPPGGTPMFMPRGGSARIWTQPDALPPVPPDTAAALSAVITAEMLRRASALPPVELAVLDEELADLTAPAAERSASSALVRLPRGSVRPLPSGDRIRLFLHWAQPEEERVDLDLSVALFDTRWRFVDLCDYTHLRIGDGAAVHSGDLTSAPEPLGASEFVDLHVSRLHALGGRYAVPIVFSFNDVPFDRLVRGFAGFMDASGSGGTVFDPLAVRQRFDLSGPAKILVPLVADLWSRTMRWADLNLSAFRAFHNVDGYQGRLARLGSALEDVFGLGEHVTLWEVACWHAAARAPEVLVRHRDGGVGRYVRGATEEIGAFAARLTALTAPDHGPAVPGGTPGPVPGTASGGMSGTASGTVPGAAGFAALADGGGLTPADGAQVYALRPGPLDPAEVRLLDAADLVGALGSQDR
ncbi:RING finger family 4 domain-containing protein [Planomonospora corallina]|uniref:RING finger family 4 domain-containing protein n=1 Tax=Planomonospora corallina TaxID=1806052 RepID=A0ABV8IAN1_9ACTN